MIGLIHCECGTEGASRRSLIPTGASQSFWCQIAAHVRLTVMYYRRFLSCLIPSSARRPSWPLANFSGVVFCGFSAKQRLWVVSVGKVSVLFFVHNCSLSLWKAQNPPISFFLQVWNLMAAGADQRAALSFLSGLHVAEFADQSSANTCSNSNNYNFDRYWKRNNSFIMADFLNQLLSLLGCFCNGLIKWL